jgi:hypothetical protein
MLGHWLALQHLPLCYWDIHYIMAAAAKTLCAQVLFVWAYEAQ